MKQQKMKIGFIFVSTVTLFLVILFTLTSSSQLKALENLISTIQPTTGHEVNRHIQDTEAGFTGPIYAEIRIDYEPNNNHTMEDLYDEIVKLLERNNWEGKECDGCLSAFFKAYLQQDDYPIPIRAGVYIHADENFVRIRMTHPRP